MSRGDGEIIIKTKLDNAGIEQGISKMASLAGRGAAVAAKAIGVMVAALAGAGTAALYTGMAFESAFAGVKKTVDATDTELAQFRQGIRDMAKELPTSANEIANIAEAAGQLGIQNKSLLSFTRTMAMIGDSTDMSATEAATALARLANITGMSQDNFGRLGSVVVALGNNLATTESEIVNMGLRLAGAGKQVGMSEATILSFAGALSSVGIEAEAGGSAFSKVMVNMQLATETGKNGLEDFAKVAGMSSKDFQKAFKEDAAGAMIAFIKGLSTAEERGMSAIKVLDDMDISEVRMRDSLLRAAGASDVFTEALSIGGKAWEENTALTKEAQQRYETLESKLGITKNAFKDLGISIYDNSEVKLKSAASAALEYANSLSRAFNKGGMTALVEKAGGIFAELVTKAVEQGSKMVNAAVNIVQAFARGLIQNKGKLLNAAQELTMTLANGFIKLLPNELQKPAQNAVNTLATTFSSLGKVLTSTVNIAVEPLILAFKLLGNNLGLVIPLVASGAAAFKAYSVVGTVITILKNASAAYMVSAAAIDVFVMANGYEALATSVSTGALTIKSIAVGVLTKQIGLATAVTAIFNKVMAANPIALAVAAVAALTVAMVAYSATHDTEFEKLQKSVQKRTENTNKLKEEADAWNESKKAQGEAIKAGEGEINTLNALWSELQTIVDTNGQITAGYEERAGFITGQLSNALGIEISTVDSVIQKYNELSGSIKGMIEQKRAELVLKSQEEAYSKALSDRFSKYKQIENAEKELAKTSADLMKAEAAKTEAYRTGGVGQVNAAEEAVAGIKKEYDKQNEALSKAKGQYADYNNTVANYEGLSAAIISGDAQSINAAVNSITFNFKTAGTATKSELKQQVSDMRSYTLELKNALANGMPGVTQEMVINAESMVIRSEQELAKLEGTGQKASSDMAMGIRSGVTGMTEAGAELGQSANVGLSSTTPEVMSTGMGIAVGAMAGLSSIDTTPAGTKAGIEYNAGLTGMGIPISATALGVAVGANSNLKSIDNTPAGQQTGQQYNNGIASQHGAVQGTSVGVALGALSGISSIDTTGAGSNTGQQYSSGVGSKTGTATSSGIGVAAGALGGLTSINTVGAGVNAGQQYSSGVGSQQGGASSAGGSVANSANAGLSSISTYGSGTAFGQGFVNGIGAMVGSAASIAASMASAAANAIKNALNIHSPSRVTTGLGINTGEGYVEGIEQKVKDVKKASIKLSEAALNGIDVGAMTSKMRSVVDFKNNEIGTKISASVNYKASGEIEDEENRRNRDMYMLAEVFAKVLAESGIEFKVKERIFARLVREVADA